MITIHCQIKRNVMWHYKRNLFFVSRTFEKLDISAFGL